jgi:hypothetical protein
LVAASAEMAQKEERGREQGQGDAAEGKPMMQAAHCFVFVPCWPSLMIQISPLLCPSPPPTWAKSSIPRFVTPTSLRN